MECTNQSGYMLSMFHFTLTLPYYHLFLFILLQKASEKKANDLQHTATTISLSIASATIVLIFCYHIYKRLKEVGLLSRCWLKVQETRCWQVALRCFNKRRVHYVRLPQVEDVDQDGEMNDDFDRGRESDEEQEEENRELYPGECTAEHS